MFAERKKVGDWGKKTEKEKEMRRKRPSQGTGDERERREGREILSGMKDWRQQHPQATLTESEEAVDERLAKL